MGRLWVFAEGNAVTRLKFKRSGCPISSWLDVFGDRWTLVIVRDLLAGKRRYGEFQASPEGIPSNILADRLRKLMAAGAVSRRLYSKHPPRYDYRLTRRGRELLPVLQAMARWSAAHVAHSWGTPSWFLDATPEDFAAGRRPE